MRLTDSQLTFLARFAKSPDGREFLELYRAELSEVEKALRIADGAEMHRQQGRAQQLDKLLADVTGAQQKLTASRSSVSPTRRLAFTDGLAG